MVYSADYTSMERCSRNFPGHASLSSSVWTGLRAGDRSPQLGRRARVLPRRIRGPAFFADGVDQSRAGGPLCRPVSRARRFSGDRLGRTRTLLASLMEAAEV